MRRMGSALCLLALLIGCGGNSSSSNQSVAPGSTQAPVPSSAQPTFRSLERGDQSSLVTQPANAGQQIVADTLADLTVLMADHQGTTSPQVPAVDFTHERVVGLFLGERPTLGHSIEVVGVAQITSNTVEVSYVTDRPSGVAGAQVTRPFHIVALANAQGTVQFVDVTQAPTTTPVTDVHGELVLETMNAGGQTLAFLEDGATAPREITDPSALTAAGARVGTTLVVTGDAEANPAGATALSESIRIVSYELDTVAITGRLENSGSSVVVRDVEGNVFEPVGSLAQTLVAQPVDRPLRITGRIDPTHPGASPGLIVTSWRETVTVAIRVAGGLAGLDERFSVDDLPVTGADRYTYSLIIRPNSARKGSGKLSESDRADLETLVTAANLRAQPATFRPVGFVVFDVPSTSIEFADKDGDKRITILYGATLPPELDALVKKLRDLKQTAAHFSVLEQGGFSRITQPSAKVARTQTELTTLWNQHSGGGLGTAPPQVDFTKQLVVAVFMGRQSSGGHSIAVETMKRMGDELHFSVERNSPAPGTPVTAVITSPFQFVVVEHKGATGDIYVDGAKQ